MSQAAAQSRCLCGREPSPERLGLHVVGADALPVDLDDRDQLAVARLELRIAVDRDPLELEPKLGAQRLELRLSPLAKVASRSLVENNPRRTTDRDPA